MTQPGPPVLPPGLTPYSDGQCWVLTDSAGNDWSDDYAGLHFDTEAGARADLAEQREDYGEGEEESGPLDVRQLGFGCLILRCANTECGEEYEGDEYPHVHWPADDPQTALDGATDADWHIGLDGGAYCPEETAVDHVYDGAADDPDECETCGRGRADHLFPDGLPFAAPGATTGTDPHV